ncbi:maleylpyruvate isomerase family mycothiol-dependent enzyme [Nocardioides ferulae]|uniref:maleylpyruvate isomerase family mycothiol-dependent enzyme n=1 Tax=Nocardioides ferulae TaxID=2340821 RepID=UPI000EB25F7C|nr:maleylpyruvate isomerase family mycothiol-dependent enzyme [Nocardioides ferulae]
MPRLPAARYLEHLRADSRRFRDVLADCDPAARVPGCPDWTAADLLWHLAEVQWFWAWVVENRPSEPAEDQPGPDRPDTYAGLVAAFDDHSARLVAALETADPAEHAWSWSADHTVGFTHRRQAHEALIHRLDAEQTAGEVTPLDPMLAADGVEECLDVMFGGTPPWGRFEPGPGHVRVDLSDTGHSIWVQVGMFRGTNPADGVNHDGTDIRVVADPAHPADVVVSGTAAALDGWLWRRTGDEQLTVEGDRAVYKQFREAVSHPID